MKHYLRNHKGIAAISALGGFLILCWFWSLSAPIRGRLAAHIDIHRGRYEVLGYGLASPSRSDYARCLRERYNVEFRTVAGCVVSESLVSYVNAYHSVVVEATKQRFGHDIFQECSQEAAKKGLAVRAAEGRQ